ncbi:MAG TPA: GNAT family N-acetyltransferase [Pusillimonas sp.]
MNVVIGDWDAVRDQAVAIRTEVFVHEQNVPPEEELDAEDAHCIHAVAYDENRHGVGTGRLLPDAHIGRMAVRQPYRGLGVGSLLLGALIAEARRRGYPQVVLAAQVHAIPFYKRHGFIAEGDVFMDAGIEHITMRLGLDTNPV